MHLAAALSEGDVTIKNADLNTPAIIIHGNGTLNMLEQQLDMQAELTIFGTVDSIVGLVPLIGKPVQKLTNTNLDIQGPVDNVKVTINPARGVEKAIKEVDKQPFSNIRKLFKQQENLENDAVQ